MVATARRKKPVEKKATPRTEVARRTAKTTKAAKNEEPFKPGDQALPGMEDMNQRIPQLDDECHRCLGYRDARKIAKVDEDESLGKIGELLKEHGRDYYVVNGNKFFEEPGSPSIKIVKVKQNG